MTHFERTPRNITPRAVEVGIESEGEGLIGDAIIYRNPTEIDTIKWAEIFEEHIVEDNTSCIAMHLTGGQIVKIDQDRIHGLAEQPGEKRRVELLDFALLAQNSSVVMLIDEREANSTLPYDHQTPDEEH